MVWLLVLLGIVVVRAMRGGSNANALMNDPTCNVSDARDKEPLVGFVGVVSSDLNGACDQTPEVIAGVCEAFRHGTDYVAGFDHGYVVAVRGGGCESLDKKL